MELERMAISQDEDSSVHLFDDMPSRLEKLSSNLRPGISDIDRLNAIRAVLGGLDDANVFDVEAFFDLQKIDNEIGSFLPIYRNMLDLARVNGGILLHRDQPKPEEEADLELIKKYQASAQELKRTLTAAIMYLSGPT